jgi:chromate transport protein ChrA
MSGLDKLFALINDSNHIAHSVILGLLAFLVSNYLVKQPLDKSILHGVLSAYLALVYMNVYNHSLPPFLKWLY